MSVYVLVGGGWLGGWCWQKVARRLRENGHDAYPATLTGLGERVHLASPAVDLETHITELVYLDTAPLPGGTLIEKFPPEARQRVEKQVEESGDGWRFPMPPREELANFGSLQGLGDAKLELLRSRAVAQPFGTFTQPLRLENPAREALPKVGILCSFSLEEVQAIIEGGDPVFREMASPTWRFVELPTGHYPMFSRPEDLAEVLLDLPSGAPTQDEGERRT